MQKRRCSGRTSKSSKQLMSGNFILEFPSMKSPILTLTHARQARIGKTVVCSLCCSHGPYINIHDVCGLG